MRIRRSQSVVIAAILVPVFALSACGSDSSDDDSKAKAGGSASSSESAEPTEDATEEAAPEESSSATPVDGAAGAQPAWALPLTKPGELLTTVEAGDVTVEIYQAGTEKAPKDGMFVDPETKESILKKGDDLIFVNYVITNNGEPITLGASLVDVTARYADWKWAQGMDGSTDSALWESQGLNKPGFAPGGYSEDNNYVLGKGETYSVGGNFEYQKSSPITFSVKYTPVDAEGELIHDERVEAKADTKIK